MLKKATLKTRKPNEKLAPQSVTTLPLVSTDVVAEAEESKPEVDDVVPFSEVDVPTAELLLCVVVVVVDDWGSADVVDFVVLEEVELPLTTMEVYDPVSSPYVYTDPDVV